MSDKAMTRFEALARAFRAYQQTLAVPLYDKPESERQRLQQASEAAFRECARLTTALLGDE